MSSIPKRVFILGDEWIFFKIYTGVKFADTLLTDHLMPLINTWKSKNYIEKWFFIRYYDPEFHLRVRFLVSDKENLTLIIKDMNVLFSALIQQDFVWKLQTDTYVRELERYGIQKIDHAETVFCHDSEMIVSVLKHIENAGNQSLRWLTGLLIIEDILDAFNLTIEEKKDLMEQYITFFSDEMSYDKFLKRQLSLKYRNNKREINSFLTRNAAHQALIDIVSYKKENTHQSMQEIVNSELSSEYRGELIFSLSHMSLNRLYRTKSRKNEFVSYHLLLYYYESKIAQLKHSKK
ncbi:thiopeptide-type bacteriocin biosynthesis protein [uncultured Dokdonia sp.]|uniref:thiopeptide-type bacteriocin biosynthesis protein n=1 Tax=uncultured Dokdonia sp. TaxID=575653 RepID=UPI00263021F9|nr:thiopeptide-type bacteriocin biosynthesis protein [uncultured Dokdonia sp.]